MKGEPSSVWGRGKIIWRGEMVMVDIYDHPISLVCIRTLEEKLYKGLSTEDIRI
jgi:hypothetical protein